MEQGIDRPITKYIVIIIVLIIIAGLVGGGIFLYNNPKYMIFRVIDNINIKVDNYISKEIVSKNNADEAYTTQSTIDLKLGQLQQSQTLKLNTNINKDNEYNIYELKGQDESSIMNVYEKEGIYYLDLPNYDKFVRLNDEATTSTNIDLIKRSNSVYKKIYAEIKKHLGEEDFYKISINEDKKDKVQVGIILTEKRFNEIVINTMEVLKNDETFINDCVEINKMVNQNNNGEVDNTYVKEQMETLVKQLKEKQTNDLSSIKISFVMSGLLREKIESIEISSQQENTIVWKLDAKIDDKKTEIGLEYEGQSYLYMTIVEDAEEVYTINIRDKKDNAKTYNINLGITGQNAVIFNGTILEYKFEGSIKTEGTTTQTDKMEIKLKTDFAEINVNTNFANQRVSKEISKKQEEGLTDFINSSNEYTNFLNGFIQ